VIPVITLLTKKPEDRYRYETGWEMIDLTSSSALLTTSGTAELVGRETGKLPPPSPFTTF